MEAEPEDDVYLKLLSSFGLYKSKARCLSWFDTGYDTGEEGM